MNKIKEYRERISMTQRELAEHLGTTTQTISNKENGRTSWNDKEKLEVRKLFRDKLDPEITIDELFYD